MDNIYYIKDTNLENNYLLKSLNNSDKLIIQTPTLFNNNKLIKHDNYYELIVPLKGKKDKKIKEFIEYIEKLEEKIIYDAQINLSTWFNNTDKSIIYNSIINNINESDKNISIKIRTKIIGTQILTPNTILTSETDPSSYNNKTKQISINNIPTSETIKMILELYSIYINQNTFELIIKPQVILFKPLKN